MEANKETMRHLCWYNANQVVISGCQLPNLCQVWFFLVLFCSRPGKVFLRRDWKEENKAASQVLTGSSLCQAAGGCCLVGDEDPMLTSVLRARVRIGLEEPSK